MSTPASFAFDKELKARQAAVDAYPREYAETVLTAARTGEVLGATWGEIDMAAKLWTIPAARMKGGRDHRVDDGDLLPRMSPPPSAASEIRVLAESFNHMLERLEVAFQHQRDFVADASHELRTPLTVISGQLEVLAAQDRPTAQEIRRVQRLVGAEIMRISRMVDDMLLLARAEQRDFLHPSAIELPSFIGDLWATTTAGRPRRLVLAPVPAGTLEADPDRLAQALRNLIDNALAHTTAPDGLVALKTTVLPGGVCRFAVLDDGPGIPAAERDRIFERFHRTDSARVRIGGGTGLGLAIVHAIAVAHGGSVAAREPSGGVGARLELTLPGYLPATVRPRQAEASDVAFVRDS